MVGGDRSRDGAVRPDSFQDHPIAALPIVLKQTTIPPPDFRHTNCCIRYASGIGDAGPGDMMIVAMNRLGDGLGRHTRAPSANFGLLGVWVNECFSRGTIRLVSRDPLAAPIIEENMLDAHSDVVRLRDGIRRLIDLARRPGFGDIAELITIGAGGESLDTLDADATIDAWATNNVGDAQHGTSSCRMGAVDDPLTVVDSQCRVLGFRGLRVIDASIMPSVPCANTHLTTVMIAEYMADQLKGN